ncbi:MAG: hypothetical protein IPP51_01770 [Bacteroidetes bacterium]|nr:hypothetical protein [Bacteroidota bacterium]
MKIKNKVDENKSSTSSSIESAIETRISQLKESIQESKVAFKKSSCKLFWQIVLLVFACFVITFKSYVFAKYLLDPAHVILHDTWKWQTIYYTAIRITVLGAIFSLATYFFKL